MNILICGDSFAADYTVKYPEVIGWPNMLASKYNVTNIAQAGVSEYKVWLQVKSQNIADYDIVVISHTSPWRVPTRNHPVHSGDKLHAAADLMINDIEYHGSQWKNKFNKSLACAADWFKYHFDPDYQEAVYELFKADIEKMLCVKPTIQVTIFEGHDGMNYNSYVKTNKGVANHFDIDINTLIYNDLRMVIENICTN